MILSYKWDESCFQTKENAGNAWSMTGPEAAKGDSAGGVIVLNGLTPVPKDMFSSEETPVAVADAVLASVLGNASSAACEGESVACGESGLSSWSGLVRPGVHR